MLVGLTGNFGSGKSWVLKIFRHLGAITIDSDEIVHTLLEDKKIISKLSEILGKEVITGGRVDRKTAGRIIFSDEEKRKRVEQLLHPLVFQEIERVKNRYPEKIIIAEIPLLFESGYAGSVDRVITVTSPEETALERLKRKGFSEEEILLRRKVQIAENIKAEKSDYVIDNSRTPEETERQVRSIWTDLLRN
ncbi:MAG: dephospho-CoA kinase [Nitrospirae bacterium]|nr:MAG: dephospho-CoA kinase [Nitrospirota bacterium]